MLVRHLALTWLLFILTASPVTTQQPSNVRNKGGLHLTTDMTSKGGGEGGGDNSCPAKRARGEDEEPVVTCVVKVCACDDLFLTQRFLERIHL